MKVFSLALAALALLDASDAFTSPAAGGRTMATRNSLALNLAAKDKPLTELCEITKEACDAVAPMLNGTLVMMCAL
jgi:hypothetical protein